jgi:hypothetical protein
MEDGSSAAQDNDLTVHRKLTECSYFMKYNLKLLSSDDYEHTYKPNHSAGWLHTHNKRNHWYVVWDFLVQEVAGQ